MVIYLDQENFNQIQPGTKILELNNELIHYFKKVLRIKKGEKILINSYQNTLTNYQYFIANFEKFQYSNQIVLNIKEKFIKQENFPIIDLFIVPLKSKYFYDLIENVSQLPINSIILIKSKFIAVNYEEISKKIQRLEKIIFWNSIYVKKHYITSIQALNKTISEILKNETFLKTYDKVIIFDHITENKIDSIFFRDNPKRIAVMIGPEGGWDRKELENLCNKIFVFKFKNIDIALKAQNAAIVGISQLLALIT